MHNSSLVAIAQSFLRIRTSVLYDNRKKINTEAVKPPIRFEIRFERKFPILGLYFLTLPVETLLNLFPFFTDALVLFLCTQNLSTDLSGH